MLVSKPLAARKLASAACVQPEPPRRPYLGTGALECQFMTSEGVLTRQSKSILCLAGRPHNANVAAVEPLVTTFPDEVQFEEDVDGEIVQDYFDRRSLERLYTQSPSQGDVPGLQALLEQVERLGQEANSALSEALQIPGLLEQAEHVSHALKSKPSSSSQKEESRTRREIVRYTSLDDAQAQSVRPRLVTPRTRSGATSTASPPTEASTENAQNYMTTGHHLSGLRAQRTSSWGRKAIRMTNTKRTHGYGESVVADLLKGLGTRLLTFEDEQAVFGKVQKYCKVERRMHEMRADLQRWPSITELAADLGTTNIEGLKQFIQEGSECKRAAVYANLRLVVSITKRHNRSAKVALSDLLSEGLKGLNIAVERFDPTLGVKFSTYAHWWIQQAVKLAHKELSHTVRLPAMVQALYIRACRFKAEFHRAHGRQAFEEEVAAGLGISPQRLKDVWNAHSASLSIDAPANAESGDDPLSSLLADETTMKQDGVLLEQDIQTSLNDAVDILSERERHVLCLRYGLKQDQGRLGSKVTIRRRRTTKRKATSLQRVSSQIDLSRERVRQVESQALLKLREVAGDNVTEALGEMTDRPRKVTRGNKASRRPQ